VGVGADDGTDVAPGGTPQALQVCSVLRAGVDGNMAGDRVAHKVAVCARAGHDTRVGRGEALHVLQQADGMVALPVQGVQQLAVRAHQGQFAKRRLVFHVTRFLALQPARAWAAGPKRFFTRSAGGQYRCHVGMPAQPLQRAHRGKHHEEVARRVASQGVSRAHPDRLELFIAVCFWRLPFGHASHQEGHVKPPGQVAVGDPACEHEHLVGCQAQAAFGALRGQRSFARKCGYVCLSGPAPIGVAGQQHAQFLKTFADGGDRLGQCLVVLARALVGQVVRLGVFRVDAATGKDIGARCEAGRHGTARHQHFKAFRRVAQEQDRGCRARGSGFPLRVNEL